MEFNNKSSLLFFFILGCSIIMMTSGTPLSENACTYKKSTFAGPMFAPNICSTSAKDVDREKNFQNKMDMNSCALEEKRVEVETLVASGELIYIPVYAHYFYCDDTFSDDCIAATFDGFADPDDIISEINDVNNIYSQIGFNVRLLLVDIFAHENLDLAWNYDADTDDDDLQNTYSVEWTMNLFYMKMNGDSQHSRFPWDNMDITVLNKDYIHGGWSLAHELGHWFGLYHSFNEGSSVEGVTRTPGDPCYNCKYAGDKLCGTPAAVNLGWADGPNVNISGTCEEDNCGTCSFSYVTSPQDNCNVPYEMNATVYLNIMNYASRWCSKNYTADQVDRMWSYVPNRLLNDIELAIGDPNYCDGDIVLLPENIDSGQRIEREGPIVSYQNISTGQNTLYDSDDKIILEPGFRVQTGSSFRAVKNGCGGTIQ